MQQIYANILPSLAGELEARLEARTDAHEALQMEVVSCLLVGLIFLPGSSGAM